MGPRLVVCRETFGHLASGGAFHTTARVRHGTHSVNMITHGTAVEASALEDDRDQNTHRTQKLLRNPSKLDQQCMECQE